MSIISGPVDPSEKSVHGPGQDRRTGVLHGLGSIKVCVNFFSLSYLIFFIFYDNDIFHIFEG